MITSFIPKRASDALPADTAMPVGAAMVDRINLMSMFNSLDAYGQRVLLAQAAAMLRVQTGGK